MTARGSSNQPQCASCHRPLKHPSPSGYGPICERRINGPQPRRAPAARPASAPGPGQPELPLDDQLALWENQP